MPFGLCNAPATFMCMMDMVFGDQNFQTVLIYLDDILIIMKSLDPLRAKKIIIRKKLGHTAVSAIKASSVTL